MIQTQRIQGAGLQLAADVGGDPKSQPLVLLHGGGQTRHSWGAAMRTLVDRGYHVLNVDLRGHGQSDWCEQAQYLLRYFAADVCEICNSLEQFPVLIGASMGGAASLYAVGSLGVQARALVLVDIVPMVNQEGTGRIREFMFSRPDGFGSLDEVADAVAGYNPHRPRPKDPSGLMKNLRKGDDGRLYWHWDPKLFDAMQKAEPKPSFGEQLESAAKNLRIPTLLIRGMKSDVVDDEGVEHAREVIPHLKVVDVGDAGHMVAGDRNDLFNAAIFEFLATLPELRPRP